MANIANPHKKFQYSIFLFGMNPFLAQKVTTADREYDIVEHGEGNHLIKTAGMVKLGTVNMEKLSSTRANELLIYNWAIQVQDEITGGGGIPAQYKRNFIVQKNDATGFLPIGQWEYIGGWPCKINGQELDRVSSDNTIETIEFCIDKELRN
jgi:hypothetical protein